MSKRLDLDAALAEQDAADEPLVVTFFGEDWELPGTIPAAVTIRLASWFEDGLVEEDGTPVEGTELTGTQCLMLLRDMVPADILREWCDRGLGTERYAAAVDHIMGSYALVMQADRMGKAGPPKGANRASRRSSTGGRSSKPTSPASTGSRSRKR